MATIGMQLSAAVRRNVESALVVAGEIVATEVRRSINKAPRGGVTYTLTNPNRVHKASAPFEPPATDLGFLVRSIQTEPDLDNLRTRILSLHSIAPYAKRLEFGDMSAGLQPRPFMYRGLQTQRQKATNIIQKALQKAVREMQGRQV